MSNRVRMDPIYPASAAVAVMRQLGLTPMDWGDHHSTWQDAKGRRVYPAFSLKKSDTVSHGELYSNGLALEGKGICTRKEFIHRVKEEAGRIKNDMPSRKERRLEEAINFSTKYLEETLKEKHARITIINILRRLAKGERNRHVTDTLLGAELERQEINLKGLF